MFILVMIMSSRNSYPVPRVVKKNEEYAKILLEDFANDVSEQTAVHLYFFQSMIVKDPVLQKELLDIAITEMEHLKLLGLTIYLLGVIPEFRIFKGKEEIFWNGEIVPYALSLKEIFTIDVQSEASAIAKYQDHAKQIQDPYIQKLLYRIIEDEKKHLRFFLRKLKEL